MPGVMQPDVPHPGSLKHPRPTVFDRVRRQRPTGLIHDLVAALRKGGLPTPTAEPRKPWSPRSLNYLLGLLVSILESE